MDGGEPGAPGLRPAGEAAAGAEATASTAEPAGAEEEALPQPLAFDKEVLEELWRAAVGGDGRRRMPKDDE